MQPLIDWVSFTIPTKQDKEGRNQWLDRTRVPLVRREVLARISTWIGGDLMRHMFPEIEKDTGVGRFPYKYSMTDVETRIKVYFDPEISHILVEASGIGCKAISKSGLFERLLVDVGSHCSRLDVSCDLVTDMQPTDFARGGYSDRFKSTSVHNSDSGQTIYVGSPKSDRQAAIYRYADPHPRSHLLRVEHRFRRDAAKDMAAYVVEHGLDMAIAQCGEIWGWRHPLWDTDDLEPVPMPRVSVDAKDSNVARWLLTQVFPAMRRYEKEGKIPDLRAFVQTYLFEEDVVD